MMEVSTIAAYMSAREIREVAVCDIESSSSLLRGDNGRTFCEVATNLWLDQAADEGVAYLGTGRHGGGIVLRPLFLRIDNTWFNVTTGKEAPQDLHEAFDTYSRTFRMLRPLQEPVRIFADIAPQQHYEELVELCESFAWSTHLKDVYRNICDAAVKVLRCSQAHMHLINVDGTRFIKCAYHDDGVLPPQWENSQPSTIGRMQEMIEHGSPIIMDYEHPYLSDVIPEFALKNGIMGAVSIPLQDHGKVLGMLSAVYRVRTRWSDEDCEFLVLMGRIIGSLIQRLYDTKKASELQILNERKLLSTEIHENVSSLLGAISVNAAAAVAAFEDNDDEVARTNLCRLEITAGETMRILRDEMFSLRITLEETDGLIGGIEESLKNFERNWNMKTELIVSGEDRPIVVPMHVSLQLTRILNECLSNTLKHAQASKVSVEVKSDVCRLCMCVKDDGRGFDVNAVESNHFGIKIMRERAAAAGGFIDIKSSQAGTMVCVEVPKRQRYQEGLKSA